MYNEILLPTDGGDGIDAAREHAFDLAKRYDARVHALFVANSNRYSTVSFESGVLDVLEEEGERAVKELVEAGENRDLTVVSEVIQGAPHEGIVEYAEPKGVDLIVMATHGRAGLDRFLIGSVTERVLRTSPVPVLAVPLGDDPE